MTGNPDPLMENLLKNLNNVVIGKPVERMDKPSSYVKAMMEKQLSDEKEGLKVRKQIYSMEKTSENLKKCLIQMGRIELLEELIKKI